MKINRRDFTKMSTASSFLILSKEKAFAGNKKNMIRLGGPLHQKYNSPEEWVQVVKQHGFSAAYCPVGADQSDDIIKAYENAAKDAGIIIAEVGAWSNPIDPDEEKSKVSMDKCIMQLELADKIGAHCCVNIAGSRGEKWDGPHPDNLSDETFDIIVECVRKIIDAVKPTRTYYTLEMMPWVHPESPDGYLKLFNAIDRKQFAVHLDPVNIVNSPPRYYYNGALIRECFEKLGPHIKSCHAKDIILSENLTTHLDETRPGTGGLDYQVYLQELSKLDHVPLMLEHLSSADEYNQAANYIRTIGEEMGLKFG